MTFFTESFNTDNHSSKNINAQLSYLLLHLLKLKIFNKIPGIKNITYSSAYGPEISKYMYLFIYFTKWPIKY